MHSNTIVLIALLASAGLLCACSQNGAPHAVTQQDTLHLSKEDVAEAFNRFVPKFDGIPGKTALCKLDEKAKQKGIDMFYQGATFESMEPLRDVISELAAKINTQDDGLTPTMPKTSTDQLVRTLTAFSMLVGFSSAMRLSKTQSPEEVRRQISNEGGMCL